MSAVEMDRGGGTGVIAGFFECSRTVITTCEQCSRTVFTTCEQCSRIADSDREHTKRLRSRPSPRPDFEARHVPKHNLARCIVASQVPASYNIDIHVANKLHNHELEAENSYQQRLTDRTKKPLSTKLRLGWAKSRLHAPRQIWLARMGPSQATRETPLAIINKSAISSDWQTARKCLCRPK